MIDARGLLMLSLTLAALAATVSLSGCPDDGSITDCSRRGLPQHYDGTKWTCKK